MELTEEQKAEFFRKYELGDSYALDYLEGIIENSNNEELEEFARYTRHLEVMLGICEGEEWDLFNKSYGKIDDLYNTMKWQLFDACGLEKDFENYWIC